MNQMLEIQELAIVITAKNYDPSLLNPELLKYSGVISQDWKLVRKPITTKQGSQIVFDNGVHITAQPNRLIFVESLNNKQDNRAKIPALVNSYVEIIRTIEYRSVGINYRGYVTCPNSTVESNTYLFDNLIQPGEWQNCGTKPVKAGVSFGFTYEDKQLNLSINEAALKLPESAKVPIVLFNGNFNYDLTSDSSENRLSKLGEIVDNYDRDLNIYKDVVSKFIKIQAPKRVESEAEKKVVAV